MTRAAPGVVRRRAGAGRQPGRQLADRRWLRHHLARSAWFQSAGLEKAWAEGRRTGMSDLWRRQITRRGALAGAASVGLGAMAACALPGAAPAPSQNGGKKQLRILQWSHFVPAYDTWMDKFVKDWGDANGVDATIDHISTDDLPARMAAEVAAKGGHDLVEANGQILTYLYEKQLADMGDVVD